MSKLSMIGEYYINADNIAYMQIMRVGEQIHGTQIFFNAYAAAANESQSGFEALSICVMGLNPTEIADFLNNEPRF